VFYVQEISRLLGESFLSFSRLVDAVLIGELLVLVIYLYLINHTHSTMTRSHQR
jgi:hypothetical protein